MNAAATRGPHATGDAVSHVQRRAVSAVGRIAHVLGATSGTEGSIATRGARAPLLRTLMLVTALAPGTTTMRAQDHDVLELSLLTIAERREVEPEEETQTVRLSGDPLATASAAVPGLSRDLARLPGMIVQEGFGGIDPPRITMRGSGLQSAPVNRGVLWCLDGLPLNATDGSFNSACIDLALAQSLRVNPGTSDPLAAVTSLGGRIDLESTAGTPGYRLWSAAGSDGLWSVGARAVVTSARSAFATDTIPALRHRPRVWSILSASHGDGRRPRSGQDRLSWVGGYATSLGPRGPELRINLSAIRPRFDVPGPLTLDAVRDTPGAIAPAVLVDRPRRETDFAHLGIDLTWRHDPAASTRVVLGAQHTDDWFRQLRANGIGASAGPDLTALVETRRRAGDHALAGGVLARTGTREQQRWANAAGTRGSQFADLNLQAGHVVAWLQDRWTLAGSLALESGLAASRASRRATGDPFVAASSSVETAAAPRLGVTWAPLPDSVVRLRYTRGLESPTFDDHLATRGTPGAPELRWTPLRVQRSDTVELGAAAKVGAWAWSCTVYHARWTDEILRLADESGAPRGGVNAPPTWHSGVEAAARWRILAGPTGRLDLALNHTWSRATFRDRWNGGRDLAGLPPHAGSAQLSWSHPRAASVGLAARWTAGTTWVDHANRLGYSGRVVFDASVAWEWSDAWTLWVGVDNLLDGSSIASTAGVIDIARDPASTALFLPGAPRLLRLGLSWSR